MSRRVSIVVLGAALVLTTACGGKTAFRLSSDENNHYALGEALGKRQLPDQPSPINATREPRVFVLEAGQPSKTIVAYDLQGARVLWKADADVQSRIAVGGDFIVEVEGKQLVARDQSRGAVRWKVAIDGNVIGTTADKDRAYMTWRDGGRWRLAAFEGGTGKELWSENAEGQLGAPAAQGGLLYVPFLSQWLAIVDGKSGEQITRLRGIDEQISMLRVTSRDAFYGSKRGVFRLDASSASGKREQATYGKVVIPAQLEHTSYGRDVYDPVQQQYSAADRARVLFTAGPSTAIGAMPLVGDVYAIHYFRYILGYGLDGALRWAYAHPRSQLVASEATGAVIAAVSIDGTIVAIEPQTGAVRARLSLGTTAQVLGATFDADGWAPRQLSEPTETIAALVAIARDHDARFDRVKELAVGALATLPGAEVTSDLLGVLGDNRAPAHLKDVVVDLLIARKDPSSLGVLTEQLAVHADFIAKTEPDTLGPVAKAMAGLAGVALDARQVAVALAALASHLDAPTTQAVDLVAVIDAMSAIGGGAQLQILTSHLLLYHADEELGANAAWAKAIAIALAAHGGPAEREVLRQVAADPRTVPMLASAIRDSLGAR